MTLHRLKATALMIAISALFSQPHLTAADLEADAFPEFDIWIKLDEAGKNRLYILAAFAEEPNFEYNESAFGISWDQRMNPCWSWRAGIRYIDKQVDPRTKAKPGRYSTSSGITPSEKI